MDKNTAKALLISAILVFCYPVLLKWFYPQAYNKKTQPIVSQHVTADAQTARETEKALYPKTQDVLEQAPTPSVALYKNQFYEIEFSTLGGTITSLNYLGEPGREKLTRTEFFTIDPRFSGAFGVNILHERADFSQTIFKMTRKGESGERIEFSYELPGEYQLIKTYTFREKQPVIDLTVRIKNLSGREKNVPFEMQYGMNYVEEDQQKYGYYDAVIYSEKLKTADVARIKKKGFSFSEKAAWAGFIKKYYALLIKPDGVIISGNAKEDKKILWGEILLEPATVPAGGETTQKFLIYAGPQRHETLKNFGFGFENVFSRGFFGVFKTALLSILKFFYQYTHNFGWALVLLTLLIKLVFAPLTHVSYSSMKKMQVLTPKMKAIQERHKKDPAKSQQEIMSLYRRNKVNPMMGCLPMLIQIPIFFAMFRLLPEAIELHGAPFIGWITDLSAPDRFLPLPFTIPILGWTSLNILPILMAASQLWYQKIMPSQPGATPEQTAIMNLMPIFFGFICYNMPAGLTLYWTLQNVFSIVQQVFINRIVIVLHHEDQ